jgi:glycosyltransferase involved in cell wall biosynthesis
VVTSTLPRWPDDTEPRFVLDLCQALGGAYQILVLAPHCSGARREESWDGIQVRRFRYFPEWGERLAYEGGILPNLRRRPWLWPLVPLFMAALVLAIARALRERPVALIHAHWLVPQGLAARIATRVARRTVPLVCTAHGADVFGMNGRLARVLQRWVAGGSACVGVVSGALGEELARRGVERGRLRVLPMGVAVQHSVPDPATRTPDLIAFAGRMVGKKGVDVLLEAVALLAAGRPRLRLCLAGGGPELDQYRALAAARGLADRVEFLGAVPQPRVRELFERAAVAAMPSVTAPGGDAEGLGLVMIEAMAAGCPVVVTDLPVVRGVIRPGENGLVFPERDAAALADALRRLLDDRALASALAARARQDIASRFSWSAVGGAYAAVFREALAAGGASA